MLKFGNGFYYCLEYGARSRRVPRVLALTKLFGKFGFRKGVIILNLMDTLLIFCKLAVSLSLYFLVVYSCHRTNTQLPGSPHM